MKNSGDPPIAHPSGPRVNGTPSVKRDWQVFGLSGASRGGGLLGAASQPCITRASTFFQTSESPLRVSFLITAAGQFRIHTGFPLSVPGTQDPGANQRR